MQQVSLRLDWLPSAHHAPFVLAKERGYYRQLGLDVAILEGKGSSDTLRLVASGAETFGFVDGGVYAKGRATGMPVTFVADYVQKNPAAVLSYCEANIKQPQDLKGKTIASAPGDAIFQLLPALLKKYGLQREDIRELSVEPAVRTPALLERRADAAVGYGYSGLIDARLKAKEAGKPEICALFLPDFGINTLGHGIVVNQGTVSGSPDTIRKFLEGSTKGWQDSLKDPKAAIDAMLKAFPQANREFLEQGFDIVRASTATEHSKGKIVGWQALEDWQQTVDLLTQYGGLTGGPAVTDYFTNEFLPK